MDKWKDNKYFNRIIRLYHGSGQIVEMPDLNHSREDIDFGAGFYLTEDMYMAKKWACTKKNSYISEYQLDLNELEVYEFKVDYEWLNYVMDNRLMNINTKFDEYDVLIGPTADDKLYDTLQDYMDGYISEMQALKYLNIAGFSYQIVLKTDKALKKIQFKNATHIYGTEKENVREAAKKERIETIRKLNIERRKQFQEYSKPKRKGKSR